MEIPLSFGETWSLTGVWAVDMINSYLHRLFAVCAAVMDRLKCIVLGLHGNLGTRGLMGPMSRNGRRRRLQDLNIHCAFPETCTVVSCCRRLL